MGAPPARGMLQHASQQGRNRTGENLWMGTSGHWPVENMVGMFIEEKRITATPVFPTFRIPVIGRMSAITHRWCGATRRRSGCAVATARGNDVLVCRYWPAGNIWGQKAY